MMMIMMIENQSDQSWAQFYVHILKPNTFKSEFRTIVRSLVTIVQEICERKKRLNSNNPELFRIGNVHPSALFQKYIRKRRPMPNL